MYTCSLLLDQLAFCALLNWQPPLVYPPIYVFFNWIMAALPMGMGLSLLFAMRRALCARNQGKTSRNLQTNLNQAWSLQTNKPCFFFVGKKRRGLTSHWKMGHGFQRQYFNEVFSGTGHGEDRIQWDEPLQPASEKCFFPCRAGYFHGKNMMTHRIGE